MQQFLKEEKVKDKIDVTRTCSDTTRKRGPTTASEQNPRNEIETY